MGNIDIVEVFIFFVPFLFSLCFHEFAHGWVAQKKGDNTAELMGRVTMNPMAHIDWLGTVILPIAAIALHLPLFGWAKPVPVNPTNLKNRKNDLFWIAAAGPLSNILLFVVGLGVASAVYNTGLLQSLPQGQGDLYKKMLTMFLILNLFLAFFNMIPVHPLDGGKVLARFLSPSANRWLENNQQTLNMILIAMFVLGFFSYLSKPVFFVLQLGLMAVGVNPGEIVY